ncbi:creatininase family protein [Ferroacidibacillus organovorans]|uniref:Creatininase n=1 Tax=Ferroacidibacillus organovorans TaxID=1765683 RepID=A0A853K8V0_9BACL|nr:creatininase family protein [Ferroacidibacillus organovorans]KYP79806.1 creatininase [Ferroacidibacillus organovorans]OAG92730.1 creatininase [Ferroacidibacillus organovorans]
MLNHTNTTTEIMASRVDTVVIPLGATEQFGPTLPMHVDTLIAELYGNEYGKALNAYVLPVLPFNTSEEHAAFKGTVTVSPSVISAFVEDMIMNLRRQGFKKFVITSGHGGSYWLASFIKHTNFKYKDIVVVHPHHQRGAFEEALEIAGLTGRNEIHGGLIGLCTVMFLCPEYVKPQSAGSPVPVENNKFADIVGWEKLTRDGNWGEFVAGSYTPEQLTEMGRTLWTTFIQKNCDGLKAFVEEANRRKTFQRIQN